MTYLATIYSYDGAIRYWTPPTVTTGGLVTPVVGMASLPDGKGGNWLTDAAGGVSADGSAVDYGSLAGHPLNAPIAHIVPTPDGQGYWLVASRRRDLAFGDARSFGSMGGRPLTPRWWTWPPPRTATATGWWPSDGGIFSFGDAAFHGVDGRPAPQPAGGGHERRRCDRWLLAGGHRRRHLRLRRAVPREHRVPPAQPPRQRDVVPPLTGTGTGSSPPTAGSSTRGPPGSSARWAGPPSMPRSWAWPPTRPPVATGWWPPTVASSISTPRSSAPADRAARHRPGRRPARHPAWPTPAAGWPVDR